MYGTNREHGELNGASSGPSLRDIALRYAQRGWNPVPIPFKAKGPTDNGWQERVITAENAPQFFNSQAQNIGVILGPTSGGLTDVDLDCPEGIAVAPDLLPETHAVFGRPSKPRSHYLYKTSLAGTADKATLQFRDPTNKATLVELRVGGKSGAQTVFPGSTHPSGEVIEWHTEGDPAETDGEQLLRRVKVVAAAALLARHWPGEGCRHGAA